MWKEIINLWKSDNLLVRAWEESYEALEIAQEMFREAVRILRESDDEQVDREIRRKDKLINRYEQDVRRKVMTHCTLRGTEDLTGGMVLVSVVIDIERIGDYAKNILDLAETHPKRLAVASLEDELSEVESEVKSRFEETIEILKNQDVGGARKLMATFKTEISGICDQIVNDLVQGKVPEVTPGDSSALALYARYLKRISAHLNNMITSVVNPFERIGFRERKNKQ